MIKAGKGERSCFVEGGKGSVHIKERDESSGMEASRRKPASLNMTLTLLNTPSRRKRRFLVDGIVRRMPPTPNVILALVEGALKENKIK